jgi:acetyltransferase-like isoleucine patch superfamily enzyme
MDIGAKFEAVRAGTLAERAIRDDEQVDDTAQATGAGRSHRYFYETDSVIASPWIAAPEGRITNFVGAYSYMNSGGYLRENVLIGRYVSIGRRVTIAAGGHNMRSLSTSPKVRGSAARAFTAEEATRLYASKEAEPFTIIDSDVWIGDGAVIRPGVHLATGSVVGANAVVVRDTSPYEIVGGVAARTIGHRFDGPTREALLGTKWWECDRETLNRYPCANVFEFIERLARDPAPRTPFETYRRD